MLMLNNLIVLYILGTCFSEGDAKDYCSAEYCHNSKQHTLCKYQSKEPANHCSAYEKFITSDNDRRQILDKINSRRNKVASGEIRSYPPAESMMKLTWNRELEESAQRWADQCVQYSVRDVKDTCRDLGAVPVGQNIATIHGDAPGLTPLSLVDVWYMELLNTNSSILSRYVPSSEVGQSHYDYFTQLVWADSKEVGCGGVKFKERLEDHDTVNYRTIYRLVCNFAPTGNLRNRTIYASGPPCSKCPLDRVCDRVNTALCALKSGEWIDNLDDSVVDHANSMDKLTTQSILQTISTHILDMPDSGNITDVDLVADKESSTQFDFFSHLYEYTRQSITLRTNAKFCENAMVVDDFVELVKKKLSDDPMIKELMLTSKSVPISGNSENTFNDAGVAAFIDRVYSKKGALTTKSTVTSDYVNSTFLVDLIEAVIFRNGDKMQKSEDYRQNTQPMSTIRPVKIQAELAEIKQNEDFTGHYFFPEDDQESSSEMTESYYDHTNFVASEEVFDDLKMSTITNDFLDDILESDITSESTTALTILSPDNVINLYTGGHGLLKKFLQNIAEKIPDPDL
ncbi:cell wall protein PRY3-like isoform X2 [Trichoplusia ni]|uniref:Cell wall protein PRY3-like isoform X2 n=1 Tax=Trichoplusia ni TaxID=7111 RepID=A0A7E5W8Q8_TRINI|nr:cell wall protein PRY3-like isoform X2 [Trichoplusia ni]